MKEFLPHITQIIDHVVASVSIFKPELALIIAFLVSIVATLFVDKYWKYASFSSIISGLLISFILVSTQLNHPTNGFFNMLTIDNFSVYGRSIILFSLLISAIFIQQHFNNKQLRKKIGDLYTILLATGLGLSLLTITTNWILAFIAIETVSIGSYILVGYFSENKKQSEASMKYVLFGSTCAAVMLYGLSLIYGFTGNLDFASTEQIQGLISAPKVMTTIALLFVFVGIGFKLGFVPFHVWTPDVYEGAPTPVTAFLSTVPKVGAIILFSRLINAWTATPFYFGEITLHFLFFVAIVTMLIGNLIALRQENIKRLMAYSSIGHTGFLLMASLSYLQQEEEILLFYMAVYVIMNLAVFAFIDVLERKTGSTELKDYTGLGNKFPILFTCFTFTGISLVGLPPTGGFIGKLMVFTSVFDRYQNTDDIAYLLLLVAGVLTAVISLFFYLKIPLYAFLRKAKNDHAILSSSNSLIIYMVGVVLSILLLIFGLFPSLLMNIFK